LGGGVNADVVASGLLYEVGYGSSRPNLVWNACLGVAGSHIAYLVEDNTHRATHVAFPPLVKLEKHVCGDFHVYVVVLGFPLHVSDGQYAHRLAEAEGFRHSLKLVEKLVEVYGEVCGVVHVDYAVVYCGRMAHHILDFLALHEDVYGYGWDALRLNVQAFQGFHKLRRASAVWEHGDWGEAEAVALVV
jgi:hypothetical protein